MGGDAFYKKGVYQRFVLVGLESSKFKPLSGTKQLVDARMMCLCKSFLLSVFSKERVYLIHH